MNTTGCAEAKPDTRSCTCHPDERPSPCERKHAYHDCWKEAVRRETQATIVALKNRDRNRYEQLLLDYAMRVRTALEV
jgi:hypothetical protein